jgi:hypothetical protein
VSKKRYGFNSESLDEKSCCNDAMSESPEWRGKSYSLKE